MVAVVTVINAISSAANGLASIQIDVSARVSTNADFLLVMAQQNTTTVRAVTWDVSGANQAMTTAGEVNAAGTLPLSLKSFYLNAPAAGEHILRVYVSGTSAGKVVGVYALASVADSSPIDSFVVGSIAPTLASAFVASTANNLVVDAVGWRSTTGVSAGSTCSAGTGQVEDYERKPLGTVFALHGGSHQTGETSTRMSWEANIGTGAPVTQGMMAVEVLCTASAGAGGGAPVIRNNFQVVGAGR